MKKLFALCLALVLVLCGCAETPAEPAVTTEPMETTEASATPVGTLYVSFGATLELVYDETGAALEIKGTNEIGKQLAEAKQDQLGKGCMYVLRSVFRYAIANELLGDAKTAAFRTGKDDPLPTEDFLTVIGQDCQYLLDEEVTHIGMYELSGDKLDADGNLTFDTAKLLATKYLGADAQGDETPADGVYTFTAEEKSCTVDVFTGLVVGISVEK